MRGLVARMEIMTECARKQRSRFREGRAIKNSRGARFAKRTFDGLSSGNFDACEAKTTALEEGGGGVVVRDEVLSTYSVYILVLTDLKRQAVHVGRVRLRLAISEKQTCFLFLHLLYNRGT